MPLEPDICAALPRIYSRATLRPTARFTIFFLLLSLTTTDSFAAVSNDPSNKTVQSTQSSSNAFAYVTNYLGDWIWTSETLPKQTCRLWKSFEIPQDAIISEAQLYFTADNGYRIFLDGREIGRGSDWAVMTVYDLSWVLDPGIHVLAVDAFNDGADAGVIGGLKITLVDGNTLSIRTDHTWRIVPETERGWEKRTEARADWAAATVVGKVSSAPWWKYPKRLVSLPPVRPILRQFWQTGWFQITLLSLCGIVVLICLRLMTALALQSKAQRLLQIERARIARDIHDDVGAGLTQLVLLGEVAQSELPTDSPTRGQIDAICERARDLLGAMDEIVWVVNSRRDTLRDFVTYICKYAQTYLSATPIRCRLDVEPDLPAMDFDLPIRRNLLLAVKEALRNAAKHSGAGELFLRIHRRDQGIIVIVEDNGAGFDLSRMPPERNGMSNMSQRMAEAGGFFCVKSTPGEGTRMEFHLLSLHVQRRSSWWNWRRKNRNSIESNTFCQPQSAVSQKNVSEKL